MRMSGLASGLDIDSMVKELMKARRTSYDNLVKKRTKIEWQQEDFRSMSTKIVDFRNNKLSSYNLSNVIGAKKSEISGDTNAISVNSTNSAAAGALNIEVTKVASVENKIFTFTAAEQGQSLGTLFAPATEDPENTNNLLVTINSKTISVAKNGTLNDLAAAINGKSSTVNATALYKDGKLSITGTQTGKDNLVLTIPNKTAVSTGGQNALVKINGIEYDEQKSNRYSVNGFDFTVKAETVADKPATISAVQDTSKIVETIKSFVSEYNSLISSINTELSEEKYRTYSPLTSDEKKEMTDDEIELWESKARSGGLKNDGTLSHYISELRIAATSLVAGIKNPPNDNISIGITTGSYSEKGKLILDEAKLISALETNPDDVTSLFANNETGVFTQMSKSSMTALTSLAKKAGTSLTSKELTTSFLGDSLLSKQIYDMKNSETNLLARLKDIEAKYYKQFTAMETAINKFNSQSSSMTSMFSS